MAWRFWEEELRSFPLLGPAGGCALWVVRREGEEARAGLRLLLAHSWSAPLPDSVVSGALPPPPLDHLWRTLETGCAAEWAWRPRRAPAAAEREGRGDAGARRPAGSAATLEARPTLWAEPLRRGDEVAGAFALAFDASPPWGEAVRMWGSRFAARVAPLLDWLPPWPALCAAHDGAGRQLVLFETAPVGAAPARPSVRRPGSPLPRPLCVPGVPAAVGVSSDFLDCCRVALDVAAAGVNVLLQGESGTGKEILARAIHLASPRRDRPFIGENCAALPETLLESELFGHKAGAFTGAATEKAGLLEAAHGGTFFLDEIGDMPLALQIKLLRVMQERRVRRLGELESRAVDLRWIAATHKNLATEITTGNFRLDLYFRLKVVRIAIPPLRARPEDIPHLLAYFLLRHGGGGDGRRIHEEALAALQAYRWPGNVRELENEALRLLALHGKEVVIRLDHLSPEVQGAGRRSVDPADLATLRPLDEATELMERYLIRKAVEACAGRKAAAARRLGLSRQGLYKKIHRYGLRDLLGPALEEEKVAEAPA